MTAIKDDLLRAIDLTLNEAWDDAHCLVQKYEADTTASWIHAVLHKMEGDSDNSRYWYRRAGKLDHFGDEPRAELGEIKAAITKGPNA